MNNMLQRESGTQLVFDEVAIRKHCELLHEKADGIEGVFVVTPIHKTGSTLSITHHNVGDIDGMVNAIMTHSETPNVNVYCGPHLMKSNLQRGKRGGIHDIAAVLALVADMDADTGKTGDMPCPANLEVETSPGNYQKWLILEDALSAKDAKPYAQGVLRASGADSGTGDVAHVWRIPGTLNWPSDNKIKRGRSPEPFLVSVTKDYDEKTTALSNIPIVAANDNYPAPSITDTLPDVDALEVSPKLAELMAENDVSDRSAHAAKIVNQIRFEGLDKETGLALFLEASGNWTEKRSKHEWRVDFERMYGKQTAKSEEETTEMQPWLERAETSINDMIAKTQDDKPIDEAKPKVMFLEWPDIDPFAPESAGGLLQDISQWALDTARRPVPEFAVMAAIGVILAVFSRRALTPTNAGLNCYLIGVGKSGYGKGHPMSVLKHLCHASDMSRGVGPEEVTSGAAIETALRFNPGQIMPWDEVGFVLSSINGYNAATHTRNIQKVLLELYSKSIEYWSGRMLADPAAISEPIFAPTLSILGMTTPETFYKGLSEDNLSNGFMARSTIIHVEKRVAEADPSKLVRKPEDSLIERIKEFARALPSGDGNLSDVKPSSMETYMHTVPWESDEVKAMYQEVTSWQDEMSDSEAIPEGIVNRAAMQVVKFATIRSISRCPDNPSVSKDDMHWSYAIVKRSLSDILKGLEDHFVSSDFEALTKKIISILKKAKDNKLGYATLLRSRGMGAYDNRMVEGALKRLEDAKQIKIIPQKRGKTIILCG